MRTSLNVRDATDVTRKKTAVHLVGIRSAMFTVFRIASGILLDFSDFLLSNHIFECKLFNLFYSMNVN
jgi:hypothetical protein